MMSRRSSSRVTASALSQRAVKGGGSPTRQTHPGWPMPISLGLHCGQEHTEVNRRMYLAKPPGWHG